MNDSRPTWDDVWMSMAEVIGSRSKCVRAQVGCVIVASDQTVVSVSYNGPPSGFDANGSCKNWCERARSGDNGPDYSSCPSVHAEINAIARADHSRIKQATLYCNHALCMICAKAVASSGVVRIVHKVSTADQHRNPYAVEDFLARCQIKVDRIIIPS